jgi:hypothetical protein
MAALIEEEGLDEDGHPMKHQIPRHRRQKRKRKRTKNTTQEVIGLLRSKARAKD